MIRKIKTSSPNRKKVKSRAKDKKPTLAQLKKRLWGLFSQYIRLKDTNRKGIGSCCTCGKVIPWSDPKGSSQACHCFPQKAFPHLVYEEINVALGCSYCNGPKLGHQYNFYLYIVKKYGKSAWDELYAKVVDFEQAKTNDPKFKYVWKKEFLEEKIKEYSAKLKKEKLKRGLL